MKFDSVVTIVLLMSLISCRQTNAVYQKYEVKIPENFVEMTPPKLYSEQWYPLNQSQFSFEVKNVNGELTAKLTNYLKEREFKINTGFLKAVDNGEWGGYLQFISSDSTISPVKIKSGNIKHIFSFKSKIYFLEGLAHLTESSGALYELDTTNNAFNYQKIIDFEDAPTAFTIYQNKLLVATYQNFYIIDNFKKQLIFEKMFWGSLYPNSIAVFDDENIFVGIRSGIVKLDLTTMTVKFYKSTY